MRVAYVHAQVACMLAELAGMQAANAEDTLAGRSLTYHVGDFHALPDRYGLGHNAVISYLADR